MSRYGYVHCSGDRSGIRLWVLCCCGLCWHGTLRSHAVCLWPVTVPPPGSCEDVLVNAATQCAGHVSWYRTVQATTIQPCTMRVTQWENSAPSFLLQALTLTSVLFLFLSFRRVLNVICSFLGNSPGVWVLIADVSELTRFHLHRQVNEITSLTCLWIWNRQWVPKRRQLELRRRGNYPKRNKLHLRCCLTEMILV